ncbi:MAG TPA: hypothetical protein VJB99_04530 [Patescibacteria group bacterium]|nr:hypothetical protein [Patescibacteria group bacterium]
MDIKITFGLEQDIDRINKTLQRRDWYQEHGYRPHLPIGITATSSQTQIRQSVIADRNDLVYEKFRKEIKERVDLLGKRFEETVKNTLGVQLPDTINVDLVCYGVWGSYHLPDRIIFSIRTKNGVLTLFHEMLHLAMETSILEKNIEQWEKERIIDLNLHSEPFGFLGYTHWQRDYHGVEKYIDPIFSQFFFSERKRFFEEVVKARARHS